MSERVSQLQRHRLETKEADIWRSSVQQALTRQRLATARIAMVVHWLLLIDMTIFSTQLSAFLLVVGHVLGEVKQLLWLYLTCMRLEHI